MSKPVAMGIIPARYKATRFPGKPLFPICGKPLVQHVYERVSAAKNITGVIVATDDQRIFDAVQAFGGRVVMTAADHPTGTDRLAEVARGLDCDLVVNVQGDEPLMSPDLVDRAVSHFGAIPDFKMGSAMTRITVEQDIQNPNVVKVVTAQTGHALYFTRYSVPYRRGNTGAPCYQHIGFYVYKRTFLLEFAAMGRAARGQPASLAQLRALENGIPIHMIETDYQGIGVDAPEDVARIEWELKQQGK